jgi:4a-hydroxytetrahydrobiopterin dehydratase
MTNLTTLTTPELRALRCVEMSGPAMTPEQIQAQLPALPEWCLENGALTRLYRFGDYYETMAFVNALAYIAHRENHHPDLLVGYNRCEVRFNTHSVHGISLNDFICAAKANALIEN